MFELADSRTSDISGNGIFRLFNESKLGAPMPRHGGIDTDTCFVTDVAET